MTVFRPCIDLHQGVVKQIVGGSLRDTGAGPTVNFTADRPASWYAEKYRDDGLDGGHVIKLGPGNDEAARAALAAWPDGLHIGGGITAANAKEWIAAGAQKVIVTSWLFPDARYAPERLAALAELVGRERIVVDLSCRVRDDRWWVAIDRWQTVTAVEITPALLESMAPWCSEFLVHAADVEGLCRGIDEALVIALGRWSPLRCVYAGGGKSIDDLAQVDLLSDGRVDLTYGSALDLFGGSGVTYADCVAWNQAASPAGRAADRTTAR